MLESATDVIDAIGGTAAAGRITGQTSATVSNWRARAQITPEHFLTILEALSEIGKTASPKVFGIKTPIDMQP